MKCQGYDEPGIPCTHTATKTVQFVRPADIDWMGTEGKIPTCERCLQTFNLQFPEKAILVKPLNGT